jgi:glycosyltransferase involved in cell wall biosynthesis
MPKPRVLLFSNWFAPGFKGGGSQAAATNFVRALRDEVEFYVVTRDRDLGESFPFRNVASSHWNDWAGARVRYLAPKELNFLSIEALIRQTPHDLIHLNSVVSLPFAAYPLVIRRFKTVRPTPIVITPHGELARQALDKKRGLKAAYIFGSKALNLFEGANWQAANVEEETDIRRVWGTDVNVSVIPVFPPHLSVDGNLPARPRRKRGRLHAVFLARVDRMKNLDFAIQAISTVPNTQLDIFGPIGQPDYWKECQERIVASGRSHDVRYMGILSPEEILPTLARYDALFMPSQNESFGYAILESLAAGCPVVISDHTPWRNLQLAGVGYDLPLHNPAAFHAALKELRDMDEVAHTKMRERAREYARPKLEAAQIKADCLALYKAALERS